MKTVSLILLVLSNISSIRTVFGFVQPGSLYARVNTCSPNTRRCLLTCAVTAQSNVHEPASVLVSTSATPKKTSNFVKRCLTGGGLAALCTGWIASGNTVFTAGYLAASYIMHDEYNSMVQATNVNPSFKLGILASGLCNILAASKPNLQEFVLPLYFAVLMASFVLSNQKPTSINQIATSLLGVVYTGYLPSFWVRLRSLTTPNYMSSAGPTSVVWTAGAAATLWTWAAIASSDVGAYFAGNKLGRHKLSAISSAAGHASPNKTVEGAIAGILSSSLVALLGAYVMRWPVWMLTGPLYGLGLGFLGLVGDLTASAIKRDAGVKDTGTLLPGHGGLLDRFDSYILSAPLAFFFVRDLLPWVDRLGKSGRVPPAFLWR